MHFQESVPFPPGRNCNLGFFFAHTCKRNHSFKSSFLSFRRTVRRGRIMRLNESRLVFPPLYETELNYWWIILKNDNVLKWNALPCLKLVCTLFDNGQWWPHVGERGDRLRVIVPIYYLLTYSLKALTSRMQFLSILKVHSSSLHPPTPRARA